VDNNASILETIMGYIKPYLLLKVTGDLSTQGQVSVALFLSCWSIFTSFICQTLSIKGRNERTYGRKPAEGNAKDGSGY